MDKQLLTKEQLQDIAYKLDTGRNIHFQNMKLRNYAYKMLKDKMPLRRSTSRGQLIHPQYIWDYRGAVDKGVGNAMYKKMFPVLYNLEIRRW